MDHYDKNSNFGLGSQRVRKHHTYPKENITESKTENETTKENEKKDPSTNEDEKSNTPSKSNKSTQSNDKINVEKIGTSTEAALPKTPDANYNGISSEWLSPGTPPVENEVDSVGWVEADAAGGRNDRAFCSPSRFVAYHTGAAIGGSSVLLVVPGSPGRWLVQKKVSSSNNNGETKKCDSSKHAINKQNDACPITGEKTDQSAGSEKDESKPKSGENKKELYRAVLPQSPFDECYICQQKSDHEIRSNVREEMEVEGIVVAIVANFTGQNFTEEALDIAKEFEILND